MRYDVQDSVNLDLTGVTQLENLNGTEIKIDNNATMNRTLQRRLNMTKQTDATDDEINMHLKKMKYKEENALNNSGLEYVDVKGLGFGKEKNEAINNVKEEDEDSVMRSESVAFDEPKTG